MPERAEMPAHAASFIAFSPASSPRCSVCGAALTARDVLDPVCSTTECRRRYFVERHRRDLGPVQQALRKQAERHRRDADAAVRRLIASNGEIGSQRLSIAVVPSWDGRITNLPERRRRAFRDHLMRIVSEATANPQLSQPIAGKSVIPPEAQALVGRVCAFCQGWCCRSGSTHAYLTSETIQRYMADHPSRRPRAVLSDYLDRVARKTYDGSCVYHGPSGCGLPPEMRSDTCNAYFCLGAEQFQADIAQAPSDKAVVAAQREGLVQRAAVITAGETHAIDAHTI